MQVIGRRLLFDWGDKVVAIEIINQDPATHGFTGECNERIHSKLEEVYECLGQIIYRHLADNTAPLGRTLNDQVENGMAWMTKEERIQYYKSKDIDLSEYDEEKNG